MSSSRTTEYLACSLHTIALCIALCVQHMQSPFAGAWFIFHLMGCAVLLHSNRPSPPKSFLWWITLAWLLTLFGSTFIWRPVAGGAATMWMLAAMPSLALCMKEEYIYTYLKAFGAILTFYACGLLTQMAFDMHYDHYDYGGILGHTAMAWPLIDPNNAAAVLNIGLLISLQSALSYKRWTWLPLIFVAALVTTGSKAGLCAGGLGCALLFSAHFRCNAALIFWGLALLALLTFSFAPETLFDPFYNSLINRLPVWDTSAQMLTISPVGGIGMGNFHVFYDALKTEKITGGFYAHNDVLQMAIEMGIPAALVFCTLMAAIFKAKIPMVSCVFLAVGLQALVEFQFYVPAVSIPLGLVLAIGMYRSPIYNPRLPARKFRFNRSI